MSRKKIIKSKQLYQEGFALEKSGDVPNSIKRYQQAVTADPANLQAWNRQMILYRKSSSKEDEVKLIKAAIAAYQKTIASKRQQWLQENQDKAADTRELAALLGLLEPSGLPHDDDTTLEKWRTRLYLLEYRIKNSRKQKATVKKTTGNRSKLRKQATTKPKKRAVKPKTKLTPK